MRLISTSLVYCTWNALLGFVYFKVSELFILQLNTTKNRAICEVLHISVGSGIISRLQEGILSSKL